MTSGLRLKNNIIQMTLPLACWQAVIHLKKLVSTALQISLGISANTCYMNSSFKSFMVLRFVSFTETNWPRNNVNVYPINREQAT